jgi:hypothetical protein
VTLNDREKMAMLLYLMTLPSSNVEKEVRKQPVELLDEAYVEFVYNCVSYDQEIEAAKVAKAVVAATTAMAENLKG